MHKLFSVLLDYEMVVIAKNDNEAIRIAKLNLLNEDPLSESASIISSRKELPYGWKNSYPYGLENNDSIFSRDNTCNEIFNKLEEKEKERKIKEDLDKKQLKFDFYK